MDRQAKAKEIASLLINSGRVLILTHKNPDGDAIGSSLALAYGLEAMGKEVENVNIDGVPEALDWLEGAYNVACVPTVEFNPDTLVLLDCNVLDRTGFEPDAVDGIPNMVVIDHHPSDDSEKSGFLVDSTAASSGTLVYEVLKALNAEVTPSVAQDIYVALHTDTGGFRFPNTDADAFHLAGKMVELGAMPSHISVMLLERENASRMKLLGLSLGTLEVTCGNRIALCHVTVEMFEATGTRDEHTDGFVNYPRSIEGVDVALLLKEKTKGTWRVALRSRGLVDVSAIARKFGGGGHRNASGVTLEGSFEDVRQTIVSEVQSALEAIWNN